MTLLTFGLSLVLNVSRIDISNTAYTRYVYPNTQTQVEAYALLQTGASEFYSTSVLDGAGRVRATASSFPGSIGEFRGQLIVYDVMGRAVQQSNPTEITSTWVPAGDDAAGWLYSSQTYDWKGRPRVSTNTDQTTRETTYGGCGCAGGEVVTIRDEMNRRQRMTYDVLGRLVKAESLNLDPEQSVYATRTDTYNARDQITRIFVQEGTSGTGQETLMTYDGHGRLATRKAPIEDNPTAYTYYADDTLKTSLDPRTASSTFIYNGRHLVTGITYCKPPGCTSAPQGPNEINAIPLTPPVGFGYDAAGNRLWMTDGLGRVDYVHDTWSRLTSETRIFNDFPGSTYPLTYDYNLAGQLKMLTDPFGKAIDYAYDQAGQMTGVTGSNFGGVTQYASSFQYRAWGGLKHMATGDGRNIDLAYNGRLQITSYDRSISSGHSTYEYYGDGRASFVHFNGGGVFDRKYSYDHVGRLSEGLSGTDARGEPYDSKNPPPYKQTYTYDVWENMSGRTNRYWTLEENPFAATYVNDRNTAWEYNAAGNVTLNSAGAYVYDTAGRMVKYNDTFLNQSYDGDGLPAKRVESRQNLQDRATIYYVRSSVLGGQPITELRPDGFKRRTYVYANGGEIARQEKMGIDTVVWIGRDPITKDDDITRDPLGGYLGNPSDVKFPDYASLKGDAPTHDADADPFDSGSGCTLDGVPIDCSLAIGMANNGGAIVAPLKGVFGVTLNSRSALGAVDPSGDGSALLLWEPGHDVMDGMWVTDGDTIKISATHINGSWLKVSAKGASSRRIVYPPLPQRTWGTWKRASRRVDNSFDPCAQKYLSGGVPVPPKYAAKLSLVAGFLESDTSAMVSAIWQVETNFSLTLNEFYDGKRGLDHGPMQLTSWWRTNHPELILGDAYDTFRRATDSKGKPTHDRTLPFGGNPIDNVLTGGNIIWAEYHGHWHDWGVVPYWYKGSSATGLTQSYYNKVALGLFAQYKNFYACLNGE